MPQEFYGSFQDNVEITDEKAGQVVDYAHPEYYRSSESVSYQSAQSEQVLEKPAGPPNYNDYIQPYRYGVFPYGGDGGQEPYPPVSAEWNPDDGARGQTQQWQQGKIGSHRARPGGRFRGLAGLAGLAATIGGWLLKLKGLAFLLKFGAAGFTALISVAIYSIAFGWIFAFGFVGLIFVHEMGHVIAVKAKGLPVKGMLFIPFFGAAVAWSNSRNVKDEAEVAIAGPLAGAIGAAVCLGIAELFHLQDSMWVPLAYIGFFLNLLNLAPVWPLDGGRVFEAINRRVWIVGFVVLLGLQIWSWLQGNPSLWLLFLLVLSGSRLFGHKRAPDSGVETGQSEAGTSESEVEAGQSGAGTSHSRAGTSHSPYYEISMSSRITLTILYFALVVVLFLGMTVAHSYMPPL